MLHMTMDIDSTSSTSAKSYHTVCQIYTWKNLGKGISLGKMTSLAPQLEKQVLALELMVSTIANQC